MPELPSAAQKEVRQRQRRQDLKTSCAKSVTICLIDNLAVVSPERSQRKIHLLWMSPSLYGEDKALNTRKFILSLAMAGLGSAGTWVGYRGSFAPDAFAFCLRLLPGLLDHPDRQDVPNPEYGFALLFVLSAPFAMIGALSLTHACFGLKPASRIRIVPVPSREATLPIAGAGANAEARHADMSRVPRSPDM